MYHIIEYEEIILENKIDDYVLIDVRSPSEYNEDTIPGAINLPVFTDEERIKVGTLYKRDSVEKARKLGLKIVSSKLVDIYNVVLELESKYKNLVFFCARGGYRSSSIIGLLDSIGHKHLYKLNKGYKNYRKFVIDRLDHELDNIELIVLYGNTGSGKTKILHELESQNQTVLDLEGMANHRGSTLGGVGLGEQNSQKKFESLLLSKILKRNDNYIYTEGESKRIGRVLLPPKLYKKLLSGLHLQIITDIDDRVEIILEDYINRHDDEIIEALNRLRKMIGNQSIDDYIESVKNKNYEFVIKELMTKYYDPMYEHNEHNYLETFYNKNINKTAENIIKWTENIKSIHN